MSIESIAIEGAIAEETARLPHGLSHIVMVDNHLTRIISELGWDEGGLESRRAHIATAWHDFGYRLSDGLLEGMIPLPFLHKFHNIVSAFNMLNISSTGVLRTYIKSREFPSLDLLKGIWVHNRDRLPKNTPMWVRALQAADRVAGMGPEGLMRLAYIQGFWHPVYLDLEWNADLWLKEGALPLFEPIVNNSAWAANQERTSLFDLRDPRQVDPNDYECEAMEFVRRNIFPFLLEENLIDPMINEIGILLDRFYGKLGQIDPVLPEARKIYLLKALNTERLAEEMEEYKIRHEEELAKLKSWKQAQI